MPDSKKTVIVITGTPATGKTTLAKSLSRSIGAEVIYANQVAISRGLYSGKDKHGAAIVKMKELQQALNKAASASTSRIVILEGHILCDMKINGATAIVIREHLAALKKRLEKRKYSKAKEFENIMCEALDYCGVNAEKNYSTVYEIMGSRKELVKSAVSIIKSKNAKQKEIELLPELLKIMKKGGYPKS